MQRNIWMSLSVVMNSNTCVWLLSKISRHDSGLQPLIQLTSDENHCQGKSEKQYKPQASGDQLGSGCSYIVSSHIISRWILSTSMRKWHTFTICNSILLWGSLQESSVNTTDMEPSHSSYVTNIPPKKTFNKMLIWHNNKPGLANSQRSPWLSTYN